MEFAVKLAKDIINNYSAKSRCTQFGTNFGGHLLLDTTSGSVPALLFLRTIAMEIRIDAIGTEHEFSRGFGMKTPESRTWLRICLNGVPHV